MRGPRTRYGSAQRQKPAAEAPAVPAAAEPSDNPRTNGGGDGAAVAANSIGPNGISEVSASGLRPRSRPARQAVATGLSVMPRDIEDAYRVARAVVAAKLAPLSYTHQGNTALREEEVIARVVIGILKGEEIGVPPVTALSVIALINKKPCVFGDGASALIQARGHLEAMTIEEIGTVPTPAAPTAKFADDFGVRVSLWRRGQREPYVGQFTVGDAKPAKLWLAPHREWWIKYPKRQLKWRAFAWPARDGSADDLMGLGIAEEMLDVTRPTAKIDTSFLEDAS
jgi:hypothetical protein